MPLSAGWGLIIIATFLINHFDLFCMRQIWLSLRKQEHTPLPFKTQALYQQVRPPVYVGWLVAFWATPTMTVAHLVFAGTTTIYPDGHSMGMKDMVALHGEAYKDYQEQVPMLIPPIFRGNLMSKTQAAWTLSPRRPEEHNPLRGKTTQRRLFLFAREGKTTMRTLKGDIFLNFFHKASWMKKIGWMEWCFS